MSENVVPRWKFLTNHASVLVCIAHDPGVLLREISERVGVTERAAHRIVAELADAGYITRERVGRRNRYTIQSGLPLPDRLVRVGRVGDLLAVLVGESGEPADTSTVRPKPKKKAGSRVE
jgi:DNA-binding transcriptional ArsR family regulator